MKPTLFVLAIASVLVASPAWAGETFVESDSFQLRLGGYVSEFASVQNVPYDTGGLVDEWNGQAAGIVRFEWDAQIGDSVTVQVYNRFFHSVSSSTGLGGTTLGLGASVAPERTLDTRTAFVDEPGLLLEHDLDRAVVTYFSDVGDFYVGRQAITWGNSNIFVPADIWTRFSPFELDTSQKRGVDAVRYLGYPGDVELDIIAEWTDIDSPGAGVRAAWTLGRTDSYGATAWSNDRLLAMMGMAIDLDFARAHGEVVVPFDVESTRLELPRATLGLDYLGEEWSLVGEYHFNGPGTADGDYLAQATSEDVQSGDRYFLGRHYGAVAVSWIPNETYSLALSAISNLVDPSAILVPTATVSLSQNVTFAAGTYVGIGEYPVLTPVPDLPSEFGAVGTVGFVQMTGYF